jgi:hypothetical protein
MFKKFEVGPMKFETKDEAAATSPKDQGKDVEQDKEIESIIGKLKNIETLLENLMADRKERNKEVDERFDAQYKFIREAVLKSCTAVIYGDNVPLVEFLDAVFLSLNLGANGNTIDRTSIVVMKHGGVSIYRSELSKFMEAHKEIISGHFRESIKKINDKLH